MSNFRIRSTRFLESKPTLFGFTPLELTGLVVLMSGLSTAMPDRPLFLAVMLGVSAALMLTARVVIGPSKLVRLFRALAGRGLRGDMPETFSVRVTSPEFSEAIFDDEEGWLTRVRDRLCRLPLGVPLTVGFRRVRVELSVSEVDVCDPISILRRERREALIAAGPYFENRVYLAVPKAHEAVLRDVLGELHLGFSESEMPTLSTTGLVSGHVIHEKDRAIHSFELGVVPLEFGLRDLSQMIRGADEVAYTLRLSRQSPRRAIQRYSLKHGSMKGFQGGASSQIEANLSASATYDTIGQLISGQDGIFSTQTVVSFVTKERVLALPQMAFLDSLIPLSHASGRDLEKLHRGAGDTAIRRTLTGIECAALSPIPFVMTRPREFPNFFTPERELLHVSPFRAGLPSGNGACFGPSGKGKSMTLASLFAYILEETPNSVIVLDNGHGFDNFMRAYGGQTFEMASSDHPARLSVTKLLQTFTDENFRQEALVDFTRFLVNPRGEVPPLSLARLRRLAKTADLGAGLGGWARTLREAGEEELAELLLPFVRGGIYGEHFDGDEVPEIRSRALYFTGPMVNPGAEGNPLMIPYFFVVNLLIASRLGRDLPPAQICWDELKYLMQYAPDAVSGMWNRLRKTGNTVTCAAQHPGQIADFKGGDDILINSPTFLLLGLARGDSPLDRVVRVPADEKAALSVRQPGDFFLLTQEDRRYWLGFAQSPLHYALFTTNKRERGEVDEFIEEEERARGCGQMAALFGAMRYLSSRAKCVGAAVAVALCFLLGGVQPAQASIFGEENVPLYAILAKHIEELVVLKDQLEKAKAQVDEIRSIYENHRRILEEIKVAASVIKSKDREMGGLNDKARALDTILDRVGELKSAQKLRSSLESESRAVGESMVYQNGLVRTADSTSDAGLVVTRQARSASPGVAAKLSAQAEGLSLQALGEIQRSQAEIIRLMTLEAADRTNDKAEDVALTRKLRLARGDDGKRSGGGYRVQGARPF